MPATATRVRIEDEGIVARVGGAEVRAGTLEYMVKNGIKIPYDPGKESSALFSTKIMYAAENGEVSFKSSTCAFILHTLIMLETARAENPFEGTDTTHTITLLSSPGILNSLIPPYCMKRFWAARYGKKSSSISTLEKSETPA